MERSNFLNFDDGTDRQIQRPRKLRCCATGVQGRGRAERPRGGPQRASGQFEDFRRTVGLLFFFGARNRTSDAEVELRGDSLVLVMHDAVTKTFFANLIPVKGVDFAKL